MKKLILIIITTICLLAMAGISFAGPFLVCTPVDNVTHYLIKIDGATNPIEVTAYDNGDGTVMIHYDLADYFNGNHHLEIAAKNMWGQSEYVPFDFTKEVPGNPLGIGLSAD